MGLGQISLRLSDSLLSAKPMIKRRAADAALLFIDWSSCVQIKMAYDIAVQCKQFLRIQHGKMFVLILYNI